MGFFNRVAEGLFFQTDRRRYWNYERFNLRGEEFKTEGPDGSSIAGLFLDAIPDDGGPAKGTVLYFHNCTYNYRYHLPQVSWMVPGGWNVILSDPEGAGDSTGNLTLAGLADDAEAVYRWALEKKGTRPEKLIILGQGAGAEAALRLLRRHPNGAAGLVIESVWATHRGWMLRRYGPGIGHLGASLLPQGLEEPVDCVRDVKIPLAFLYPTRDRSVPEAEMDEMLKACPAQREAWVATGERTVTAFGNPTVWRDRFLEFAAKAVGRAQALA